MYFLWETIEKKTFNLNENYVFYDNHKIHDGL